MSKELEKAGLPVALISAMLAAAAGPLRNSVGNAQKGDGKE